jgi:hypothetical protein
MNDIPVIIGVLFIATTLLTVWLFYLSSGKNRALLLFLLAFMLVQGIAGISGFYQVTQTTPPRFILLIGPGLLFSILLFITGKGRRFVDNMDIRKLTLLHSVRVPVEITLYFVYAAGLIPVLMTFEGRNYDIFSGITAPVIYYIVFTIRKPGYTALLVWNLVCLGLLLNIMAIAILSSRTPFQQLAFDQPNIGVTYFPYIWLPAVVVPIVLISHLAAIRQLVRSKKAMII